MKKFFLPAVLAAGCVSCSSVSSSSERLIVAAAIRYRGEREAS